MTKQEKIERLKQVVRAYMIAHDDQWPKLPHPYKSKHCLCSECRLARDVLAVLGPAPQGDADSR